MSWHPDGVTTVTPVIVASTWTPAVFGAGVANRVLFISGENNSRINVRATGEADNLETASTTNANGCGSSNSTATTDSGLICPADASGSIDVFSVLAGATPMRLLGSLDATADGQVLVNDAVLTAGFVAHQVTSLAGTSGCALLKIVRTLGAGTDSVAARPTGLAENVYNTARFATNWIAQISATVHGAYMLVPSNGNGEIDLLTDDIAAKWTITVVATIDDWQAAATEIWTGVIGVETYVTQATGLAGEAFLALIGSTPHTGAQRCYASARSPGNAADYRAIINNTGVSKGLIDYYQNNQTGTPIFAESDAAGNVDLATYNQLAINFTWDLIGYVLGNEAPVVVGTTPAPASVAEVGSVSSISFTTADDIQVDGATIDLDVTVPGVGVSSVVIGGVAQDGWSFVAIANASHGFNCTATSPTPLVRGAWSATASCDDALGATGSDTWGWDIADAPTLEAIDPTGVVTDLTDGIRFKIVDDLAFTLTLASLVIRAVPAAGRAITVFTASAFATGWGGVVLAVNGGQTFEVRLSTMPDLASPMLWTWEVEITSTSGISG